MATNSFFLILLSVFLGAILALQGPINFHLSELLSQPLLAALFSFAIGIVAISILNVFMGVPIPSPQVLKSVPKFFWLGGLIGATYVVGTIFVIPKIGSSTYVAAIVFGQFFMALWIDHFGLLGMPIHRINFARTIGIGCMFLGLFLVKKN